VSAGSVLIARKIGMREDRVASLRYAGMLHDIGKLGVPTRVLQKTGRLNAEELASIQLHPVRGLEMVREIDFLDEALAGIMHHHERLDGQGYPMGLAGEEIPEFARAIAVADAFDSMTTTRSYRGARSTADALDELIRCAGSQFDPRMVTAMVAAIEEHGWEAEAVPIFPVAEEAIAAEEIDPELRPFDHDDPVEFIAPLKAS
jgi:HD-GYP domain-containing protein (c-di-GMP phosphodiesterase class II)